VALTAFHVQINPLRSTDGDIGNSIMEKFTKEGKARIRKRDDWHQKYVERRKRRRLEQENHSSSSSSSATTLPEGGVESSVVIVE